MNAPSSTLCSVGSRASTTPRSPGHLEARTSFQDFFAAARLNPDATRITGVVCGVRVETVEDPLLQKIRYLDKLVDELAKGRPLAKVLRQVP